jgi:hypothetical protein
MNRNETFATAAICMDGRVQGPNENFIQEKTGAEFVDRVPQPGLEGIIWNVGHGGSGRNQARLVNKMLLISTQNHSSLGIVVGGHDECAGNPIGYDKKEEQIVYAADIIEQMARAGGSKAPVFATYTDRSPQGLWVANEIPRNFRNRSYPTLGRSPRL